MSDVVRSDGQGVIFEDMLEEARCGGKGGRPLSWSKRWGGLARRSTGDLRKLVQRHARLALQDLGYLLTLLVVCLTLVRLLPLFTDLWQLGSCRLSHAGPRRLLLLHLRGAGRDLQRGGKLLFFSTLVLLLGVGVPSFLCKLPGRMRSLEDATACAQEHLRDTLKYFGELLILLGAWRSYKLLVTASLYAVLVPPACLAEAIPRALSSVQGRFLAGVAVWLGLAVGAFLLTLHTDSAASEQGVRAGFLALFGALTGIVTACVLSLQARSAFRNPIVDSSTGENLSVECYFSFCYLIETRRRFLGRVVVAHIRAPAGSPGGAAALLGGAVLLLERRLAGRQLHFSRCVPVRHAPESPILRLHAGHGAGRVLRLRLGADRVAAARVRRREHGGARQDARPAAQPGLLGAARPLLASDLRVAAGHAPPPLLLPAAAVARGGRPLRPAGADH